MAHWRKPHPPTSQFNSIVSWAIGASILLGTIILVSAHHM